MPKYTLSFTVESEMDPSSLLDELQAFAVDLAPHLEDESGWGAVEDSCCVSLVEEA